MNRALRLLLVVAATGGLASTFSSVARADALPPDTEQCDPNAAPGHSPDPSKIGATCDLIGGGQGTCHCSVCTGLSYADAGPDAHGPTGSVSFACLECKPGTQTNCSACPEPDAGDPSQCVDSDAGPDSDAGGSDGGHGLGGDPPDGGNSTVVDNGGVDDGGCSVGGSARAAAPWLLAGIIPLFLRRRRRAR